MHKEGLNHALHRIFDHFGLSKYQKNSISEITIFELPRLEIYISTLCPLGSPPPTQHPNRVKNT